MLCNIYIYFNIRVIVFFKSVSANTNPALLNFSGTANWPPDKKWKMLKNIFINKQKNKKIV